ncbi:hypothetical protein Q648_01276 [Bartonella quintana JK 12]|nr:hypothetical protein Q648_01276 [Bartonella quintana JK 12]ETS17338.1 hypothetical protein Q647_01290 [Bartonella quintana JK 7]
MINFAPARSVFIVYTVEDCSCSEMRIVPAPKIDSGTSCVIALIALSAFGVRNVISIVFNPPLTRERSKGIALCRSSIRKTGINGLFLEK